MSGEALSTESKLYTTRQSARKTAGYVGLQNIHQLRDLYQDDTWKQIFDPYFRRHRAIVNGRKFTNPRPMAFIARMKQAGQKGYGTSNPDTSQWVDKDWACHAVMEILNNEDEFNPTPAFGPHEGEHQVEAWNRAYQLLLCAVHYSAHGKYNILFHDDAARNHAAIKPAFMTTDEENDTPSL